MYRFASVALIALAACQSSRFATRGDQELAADRPDFALANYREALRYERLSAEQRVAIEASARFAANALAKREIEKARALPDDQRRFNALAALIYAGAWGSEEGLLQARRELDVVLARLWKSVENAAEQGRIAEASRLGLGWLHPAAADHPLRERLETLRREAGQKHAKLAENAPLAAAWFHATVARRYGVTVARQLANPRTTAATRWRVVAPKECSWLADRMKARATGAPEDAVELVVTLKQCKIEERRSTRRDSHRYIELEPAVVMREESYWEVSPERCEDAPCARFDPLGVCVAHQGERRCDPPSSVFKKRTVPMIEYRADTITATHTVHLRAVLTEVTGKIGGPGVDLPIQFNKAVEDSAFWTPAHERTFTTPDRAQMESEAESAVLLQLGQVGRQLDQNDAATLEQAGMRAASQEKYLEADDAYVRASIKRGAVINASAMYFLTRYGIEAGDVQVLINGQIPGELVGVNTAPAGLPPAAAEIYSELENLVPVVDSGEARGLQIILEPGLDLGFQARMAPMNSVERTTAISANFRIDGALLRLEGSMAQLGSQTKGASFYLGGLAGELDDEGWIFGAGVHYGIESAASGERFQIFSFPLTFYVPVTTAISADLDIRLNIAQLKEWINEEATDPHFYSPISLGLTGDLWRRAYLTARLTHYLGIGAEIHAGLELGVRL